LNSNYSCDADSSALARYVIALLKKDKSDKDLKRIMIEQLDVFLSEETTRFVERLFDAIASEEYLTVPAAPLITASSASANELDLDQELALAIDGAQDIEAVLAADSPPPPPKDNVINPDSNQVKLEQVSHDAREAEALAFISQEAGIGSQPDVKPAFDVSLLWSLSHSIFCNHSSFLPAAQNQRVPQSTVRLQLPTPPCAQCQSTWQKQRRQRDWRRRSWRSSSDSGIC